MDIFYRKTSECKREYHSQDKTTTENSSESPAGQKSAAKKTAKFRAKNLARTRKSGNKALFLFPHIFLTVKPAVCLFCVSGVYVCTYVHVTLTFEWIHISQIEIFSSSGQDHPHAHAHAHGCVNQERPSNASIAYTTIKHITNVKMRSEGIPNWCWWLGCMCRPVCLVK